MKKTDRNYIFTENATFNADILDREYDEDIQARREKRLEEAKSKPRRQLTQAQLKKRARRRWFIFGCVFALVLTVALMGKTLMNLIDLSTDKEEREKTLESLERKIEQDEITLQQVNSDEYVEQQARDKLRMIKDGETMYVIRDSEDGD